MPALVRVLKRRLHSQANIQAAIQGVQGTILCNFSQDKFQKVAGLPKKEQTNATSAVALW